MSACKTIAREYSIDIENDNAHIGRGILLPFKNKTYMLTAAHVYYGVNFDRSDFSKIEATLFGGYAIAISKALLDVEIAKINDLCIFEVEIDCNHATKGLSLKTQSIQKNPLLQSFSMIKPASYSDENDYSVSGLMYEIDNGIFSGFKIEMGYLVDYKSGSFGADHLQGISGSGLFFEYNNEPILHGIIVQVPNGGTSQLIECASLDILLSEIDGYKHSEINIDSDGGYIKKNARNLRDNITTEAAYSWGSQSENIEQYNRIDRKMLAIHESNFVECEKIKIIKNLLDGRNFIENVVKNDHMFYDEFLKIKDDLSRQSLIKYASNIAQANSKYEQVLDECLEILKVDLSRFATRSQIVMLANYISAEWLADCMLNIVRSE